jgi:hypothetical protein
MADARSLRTLPARNPPATPLPGVPSSQLYGFRTFLPVKRPISYA